MLKSTNLLIKILRKMKKLFVFVVLAVFAMSFTVSNDLIVPPPVYYGFTIKWDPSNCDCSNLTNIWVSYQLKYDDEDCIIIQDSENITELSTVELFVNGYDVGCFEVDCPNCYTLTATVYYSEGQNYCCGGAEQVTVGGTELNNGEGEVLVELE